MTAQIYSATIIGFDAELIEVECDSSKGLPSLQIVGLGNKAIEEAKERVRSAIQNSHFDFPARRVTINLAPANLPKRGAHLDLPIAIAILVVSGQLRPEEVRQCLFAGELALNGSLRPIPGCISFSETARRKKLKYIFVPKENAAEAAIISGVKVYGVANLHDLFLHLKKECQLEAYRSEEFHIINQQSPYTLTAIRGQEKAKRALIIAAAGNHNILLTGPPGTGKTMLAKTLASLLPSLSLEEQIEVTKLHSAAGENTKSLITKRPFRSPHHSTSHIALIGGGTYPKPGEISLAHNGVLFLDELPEFNRLALEALRQPLEDRQISISRANERFTYPANFMLIATQNPCPCGYLGDSLHECSCSQNHIANYKKRISGPLLDRIDLVVKVSRVDYKELHTQSSVKNEADHLQIINQARLLQHKRYGRPSTNAMLSTQDITSFVDLSSSVKSLLEAAAKQLLLSTRAYFKIIKIAQTIADLEGEKQITEAHVSEALQYRWHNQ